MPRSDDDRLGRRAGPRRPASSIAGQLRQAIDRPLPGMHIEATAARAITHDLEDVKREALEDLPGMRETIMSRLCLVLIAFWRLGVVATQQHASPRVLVQNFMHWSN